MSDQLHKLNCWEFKNCGREPGGLLAEHLGQCPVAVAMKFDGINGGIGGGRICWIVNNQGGCPAMGGTRASGCHECDFYRRVVFEEDKKAAHTFRPAAV